MSRPVPSATAALQVLRYLSLRTAPVPAGRIALDLGLPRSTTYHLLHAMAAEAFVVHYPDDQLWGVGVAAWEVGQGFTRQEPLTRLARVPIARLVDATGVSAHLAVLHGADVVYLIEERATGQGPAGHRRRRPAARPPDRVRPGDPRRRCRRPRCGRCTRAGTASCNAPGSAPVRSPELRAVLAATRRRGYAEEDSEVTEGFSSVAVGAAVAVQPRSGRPHLAGTAGSRPRRGARGTAADRGDHRGSAALNPTRP